jgi:ferredoxin-NADP reductase
MIEFDTDVLDIIQRTRDVKSFRFKPKSDAEFKAGQFFLVTIDVGGKKRTKHFSFSNSPTEKGYIEFTKRLTESPFSKALDRLQKKDWARVKMPYGSFTLEGGTDKIAFLSGGIGITPIRSICKYALDLRLSTDIVLLYSSYTEKGIIFREDLDRIKSGAENIDVIYTLTSPDIDKNSWGGKTGYIDERMIKETIPDFSERTFYICGPPKMVEGLSSILKEKLDIKSDKIRVENFSGY